MHFRLNTAISSACNQWRSSTVFPAKVGTAEKQFKNPESCTNILHIRTSAWAVHAQLLSRFQNGSWSCGLSTYGNKHTLGAWTFEAITSSDLRVQQLYVCLQKGFHSRHQRIALWLPKRQAQVDHAAGVRPEAP